MFTLLRWSIFGIGLCVVGGTLLSLSRHPHWFVRGWDFPRAHLAALAALSGGAYAAFFCDWRVVRVALCHCRGVLRGVAGV